MKRETLTLVGRAHSLAFKDGTATWTIAVRRSDRHTFDHFNLRVTAGELAGWDKDEEVAG